MKVIAHSNCKRKSTMQFLKKPITVYGLLLLIGLSLFGLDVQANQFALSKQSFGENCQWQGRLIHEIQGKSIESPYEGLEVQVAGVVTGVFPELRGFTLQSPEAFEDDNPLTSEGIFIWIGRQSTKQGASSSSMPALGSTLLVSGTVAEFHGMTQLNANQLSVLCSQRFQVWVTPLTENSIALEQLEGMQVILPQVQVSSVAELDLYGVFSVQFDQSHSLKIDDSSHKTRPFNPYGAFDLQPEQGLRLKNVKGILMYSFDDFRLHLQSVEGQLRSISPKADETQLAPPGRRGDVRVLSLNTENYFNGKVHTGQVHYLKSRGPRNQAEYQVKKKALLQVVQAVSPDILVLQEVENDVHQQEPAIEDLLQGLQGLEANSLENSGYELVRFSVKQSVGYGDDQITQFVIIKKGGRLRPVGFLRSFASSKNGAGRPLLLQEFRWVGEKKAESFYLATSHLKSKRNSCGPDLGCTSKRQKQAQQLDDTLLKVQAKSSLPVLWVGDFNAQPHEPTMKYLAGQYWQALVPESSYSYVFRGQKMLLDYALWRLPRQQVESSSIEVSAQIWNLNHNTAVRVSDHDPVIIDITL